MRKDLFAILCILSVLVGCSHQPPQRPSQRKGEAPPVDSAQLALMQVNKELAETADKQLMQRVLEQDEPYAMYEAGAWAAIIEKGDTDAPAPQRGEQWVIRMRICDLDGHLLNDTEATYTIGKHELPNAVEQNIGEWHRGCRVKMFVPWYAAFGMQGTKDIPPYENVMIELELK